MDENADAAMPETEPVTEFEFALQEYMTAMQAAGPNADLNETASGVKLTDVPLVHVDT